MRCAECEFLTKVVDVFLRSDVAILPVIVSLLLGVAALLLTPREEDPQIVVPMADILVSAPGLSALEGEEQVATLWAEDTARYDDHSLRRIAEQLQHELQALPNTNRVSIVGGRPRRIRVELDPARLAARQV